MYEPKHRGEPKVVYRLHYRESERVWGQDFWYVDFNTREEAEEARRECNSKLPTTHVPDYYIQAEGIEEITL